MPVKGGYEIALRAFYAENKGEWHDYYQALLRALPKVSIEKALSRVASFSDMQLKKLYENEEASRIIQETATKCGLKTSYNDFLIARRDALRAALDKCGIRYEQELATPYAKNPKLKGDVKDLSKHGITREDIVPMSCTEYGRHIKQFKLSKKNPSLSCV